MNRRLRDQKSKRKSRGKKEKKVRTKMRMRGRGRSRRESERRGRLRTSHIEKEERWTVIRGEKAFCVDRNSKRNYRKKKQKTIEFVAKLLLISRFLLAKELSTIVGHINKFVFFGFFFILNFHLRSAA